MSEPTKISLDEAAVAAGWGRDPIPSIRAHALTLDQLHGRKHPVDPLLIEAREICAKFNEEDSSHKFAADLRNGIRDNHIEMMMTLAAIQRGMELSAPVPVDDAQVEAALTRVGAGNFSAHVRVKALRNAGFIIIAAARGEV